MEKPDSKFVPVSVCPGNQGNRDCLTPMVKPFICIIYLGFTAPRSARDDLQSEDGEEVAQRREVTEQGHNWV